MRSSIREAGKCLLLGALTTVAVAWWFACRPQFSGRAVWQGSIGGVPCYSQQVSSAGSSWLITDAIVPSPDLTDRPEIARKILAMEMELLALQHVPSSAGHDENWAPTRPHVAPAANSLVIEHRHGWPLRALTCHVIQAPAQEPVFSWCAVVQRQAKTNQLLLTRMLPLRPLWPGFLIDVVLYASIWLATIFGVTSARRLIRIRRGTCPRCGYDLRGQRMDHGQNVRAATGCPECGWNRIAV
jgi:hypothetical protein